MLTFELKSGLHLASLERRHAKAFFELLEKNRKRFTGILGFIERMPDEKAVERLIDNGLKMYAEGTGVFWTIWDGEKPVGDLGARDINPVFRSAELSYFIDEDYEGRGIISESVQVLIRHMLVEHKLERLMLRCDVSNERSQNIAKRFGFTKEGIERHGFFADGKFRDMFVWSLLREDFDKLNESW